MWKNPYFINILLDNKRKAFKILNKILKAKIKKYIFNTITKNLYNDFSNKV